MNRCIDCNKITKGFGKRCYSCALRKRMKTVDYTGKNNPMYGISRFGKNNPNYKYGKTLKIKHCKCGKKIHYLSSKCLSCKNKGKGNPMWKREGVRGYVIVKHHIDLDTKNNLKFNLLKITQSKHNSLHKKAYNYLVKIGMIHKYVRWFVKHYGVN